MYYSDQQRPLSSEDRPRRGPDDVIFQHKVSDHHQGIRYRWTEDQAQIFREFVQQFPDYYAENINVLLEKLEFDGYEGIKGKSGINFKAQVLIPKVLSKIPFGTTTYEITLEADNYSGHNASHQNLNLPAQVEDHHLFRPISNLPPGNPEPGHGQFRETLLNDVHPGTAMPLQARPVNVAHLVDPQGNSPRPENLSQGLHESKELLALCNSIVTKVSHLQGKYSRSLSDASDDENKPFDGYDKYQ
ncbi:hypothetical protein Daesc_004070 [Daldinia eschscholtzii]|uniref:Uncharacterized protein n=1 Tax=Daldinia eschscholtzii TaxID=292717 RepID=A0AAX6MN85_9PEZI